MNNSSLRESLLRGSRAVTITVATLLLLGNLAVILYGVFMRYVAGGSPIWMDELSRFLIIFTVMLAAGAVWVEGIHMRVALIERMLPERAGRVLALYQWLLTVALCFTAAWFCWHYAQPVAMFRTMGLGISRSIPVLALPFGFALLGWQALLYGRRFLPIQDDGEH
mgnify:CR=1 FL=1